jgi:hypothetical protein
LNASGAESSLGRIKPLTGVRPPQLAGPLPSSRAIRRGEVRPYISAPFAASLADKPWFDIGKPNVVRPLIGAHRDRWLHL